MITDAIRGVIKEKTKEMLTILESKNVKFIHSSAFDDMVHHNLDTENIMK